MVMVNEKLFICTQIASVSDLFIYLLLFDLILIFIFLLYGTIYIMVMSCSSVIGNKDGNERSIFTDCFST